jgi:hypothetical protein
VLDAGGRGIEGVRVQCGTWHWSVTDAQGRYVISSLVPGRRSLVAAKPGQTFTPPQREVAIEHTDVSAEPFTAR